MTPEPSSTPSPTTISAENPPSETDVREDAEGALSSVLHDSDETIKATIQLIWDGEKIDLEAYYRRASAAEEGVR